MNATLGFDTATSALTVAVVAGGVVLAERDAPPAPTGRPRHATHLLPAVESAVAEAGGWQAISRIAVGIGPGAFTGLRIGVTTARALAQGRKLDVAGICSLAALAAGGVEDEPAEAACLAVLDAKRGEAFAAFYDPAGNAVCPAWVGTPADLARRVSVLEARPLAVGDGAVRFRDELEDAGARIPRDGDRAHRVRARHVCRLGAAARTGRPEEIEPNYLRRPDAELWRERDHRTSSGA